MNIEKKELFLGDYVTWNSDKGQSYGSIMKRVTDGTLNIPQTDFSIEGSSDNPAYLVRLYQPDDKGNYQETNNYAGVLNSNISRVPSPENMKDVSIDIEEQDDEDDTEDQEEEYEYIKDRQAFETACNDMSMSNAISSGDYVRFEVSSGTYKGRVLDVVSQGDLMSSAGFKLDGREDDPAVLIRMYRENEDGSFEESDMKVVHRMSSLIKIPSLAYNNIPKPGKSIDPNKRETKVFSFDIRETKEVDIDGDKYGVVRGYASTYGNIDRGNDRVIPGAFKKSLDRYIQSGRPIKMYYNHDSNEIIGGFPVDKIKDDQNGLYVEGQINLGVQKGREAYALAKQGVMQDFSIGYTVDDYDLKNGIRELKQLELWEISMVGEPMNPDARIMTVKSVTPYQDLPLADENHEWDSNAAIKRVRDFTNSDSEPSSSYKRAFMWFDSESPEDFGSYKLPYADVVDGKLMAIPRAISAIAAVLNGGRGGADISNDDKSGITNNVNRYYEKMDKDSPLKANNKSIDNQIITKSYHYDDVINLKDKRDFEKLLRDSGLFSRKAATYLSSLLNIKQSDSGEEIELKNEVQLLLNQLQNRI